MTLTLYSKPDCQQCKASDRRLTANQGEGSFAYVDMSEDPDAMALVKDLGYLQAPVILVTNDDGSQVEHWSGYRPDKIDEYHPRA